MFKCNESGMQFNSIQFSQEYSNQKNERKKNQTRTQDVTEFRLKMSISGTPNLQQLRLSRNTKK
jgi:hypothetical protein